MQDIEPRRAGSLNPAAKHLQIDAPAQQNSECQVYEYDLRILHELPILPGLSGNWDGRISRLLNGVDGVPRS